MTDNRIWVKSTDAARELSGKRVLADIRQGRRWHFRGVCTVALHGPTGDGLAAIQLIAPTPYPRPEHETDIIDIPEARICDFRRVSESEYDYQLDGTIYLHAEDEYEDQMAWPKPSYSVSSDGTITEMGKTGEP